ncbi:MAG TPA: hypothetical protein VNY73_00590 [Bacteroidia bacterium]|jgi:hypothetical protein|nr:hypothetical protein [Bacteroidia bacterium]
MILDHYSYKDFKDSFYDRIKNAEVFESGGINFMKVVLECLVVRYALKGKIRQYIFYPFPGLFIATKRFFLTRNKTGKEKFLVFEKNYANKTYNSILVDSGRTLIDKNNNRISFYYHNIRSFLESKGVSYLHYFEKHDKDVYDNDYSDHAYREFIKFSRLTTFDRDLLKQLRSLKKKIQAENCFTEAELQNIYGGLTVFFETARVWNYYLGKFKPEKIYLLGHYHREGIIYASRKNNVKVIELQHGLIAEEDIFYVLPKIYSPIKEKGLFADKIYTYGNYWNSLLKKGFEYSPEQVKTLGYYLYEDANGSAIEEEKLKEFCNGHKVVLITTQPALHNDFCNYLNGWMSKLGNESKVRFILKLHPADTDAWYNDFASNPDVLVTRTRLEVLFKYSVIHLTSYSTTLFDSMRYNVKNFSVNFPASADYVKKIVEDGFSELLEVNEYPDLEKTASQKTVVSYKDFFEAPNLELLLQ